MAFWFDLIQIQRYGRVLAEENRPANWLFFGAEFGGEFGVGMHTIYDDTSNVCFPYLGYALGIKLLNDSISGLLKFIQFKSCFQV